MALEKHLGREKNADDETPGKVFQATLGMTPVNHCRVESTLAKLVEWPGVLQVLEIPDIL